MKLSMRKKEAVRQAINQAMRKAEHAVSLNFRAYGLLSSDIARQVFCALEQVKDDAVEWSINAIERDGRKGN